jgi:RNA polymerase sigma-70 factor (ECF subfamily)
MKADRDESNQPNGQPDDSARQDAELVARTLAGEQEAFNQLVGKYERQAMAVSYRLLNQVADAQEVVQDALLKAYRALDTLENPHVFGSWLLRIVSNLSLNYRRSRARRSAISLQDNRTEEGLGEGDGGESLLGVLESEEARPEQELITDELSDEIRNALDELPERQRMALTLFSIEKMPQKEVAEVLGCSVEAVKWHVFSARKKLKDKLSKWLGDDE